MEMAKPKTDFDNDIINILGQDIKILFSASSDFFNINQLNKAIVDIAEDNNCGISVLFRIAYISSESQDESFKVARKLHCQFGQASTSKLQNLMKAFSIKDEELLKSKSAVKYLLNINNQV